MRRPTGIQEPDGAAATEELPMSSLSVYHVSSPEIPNKVLTHFEDIASTLAEQGVQLTVSSPAEFRTLLQSEKTRWASVIKFSGAK